MNCHLPRQWTMILVACLVVFPLAAKTRGDETQNPGPLAATNAAPGRIGITLNKVGDDLVIARVEPGSPAAKAGLAHGLTIKSITGVPATGLPLADALKLLRGPVGSKVEVEVLAPGQTSPRSVVLTRAVIVPIDIEKRFLDSKVGLLTIHFFGDDTPRHIKDALAYFLENDASGVILDMRDFSGGGTKAITAVAGYFLGPGKVVCVAHVEGRSATKILSTQPNIWFEPVVVLAGSQTMNFGETFVAALKESGRAKILGQTTAGFTHIQMAEKQADGTTKFINIGSFYSATDEEITGKGVQPDVLLDENLPTEKLMEKAVEALKN